MLLKKGELSAPSRLALEAVLRQAERIAQLIEDLLAVVRVRPGAVTIHARRFDLSALIREITKTLSTSPGARPIQVESDGALIIDADPTLTTEALVRLLQTAFHLSSDQAPITVKAGARGQQAIVAVNIPDLEITTERLPHAFEPFYLLIPSGAPRYTGYISLGLYLAKQIIEANGGQVELTSAPGQGATFCLSLPLAQPPT